MLNSRKKNSRFARQKKYSNSRVVRKKNSERNNKTKPPPCKLNGRSLTCHRIYNKSSTPGATSGAGTFSEFVHGLLCCSIFCFLCSVLSFFLWSLYCLSFNLRLLILKLYSICLIFFVKCFSGFREEYFKTFYPYIVLK
jgi:hypothetical protein